MANDVYTYREFLRTHPHATVTDVMAEFDLTELEVPMAVRREIAERGEKMATPVTVGRIVYYTLSEQDAEHINRQRMPILDSIAQAKVGAQVHIGNSAREGDVLPMLICRVWEPVDGVSAGVNGQVFLDGNDSLWVTSRHEGDTPGDWSWPPRI